MFKVELTVELTYLLLQHSHMKSSLMRGNKCSKRERGGGERDSERTIEGGREREKERERETYIWDA